MSGQEPDRFAPFCPGSRDMRPDHGRVEHLDQISGLAPLRQQLKERLKHATLAQPPEPLPDAVPVSEFLRKRPPSDVVYRKIVESFQELAIVTPLVATTRARRPEQFNRESPFVLGHLRQHGRLQQKPTLYESPKTSLVNLQIQPDSICRKSVHMT